MCGILGAVNLSMDEQILNLISHRGPDDSSISPATVGPHMLTLGHRRLSILDLSPAGRQPMWTPDENYSIVFNGEVYNHLELRPELSDVRFRGHSDTETMLHFLARYGIKASTSFNGIFAFAFLDGVKRKLFLVRDPFGVKPLYYWADEGAFAFASELTPIRALVDDELEPAHLAELLRLRFLPSPYTLFKRIRKVRPGYVLEVDLGERKLSWCEYPFTSPVKAEPQKQDAGAVLDQYAFLVEQAVKRQLLSDVEVGMLLSGGVDSALVAALARKHSHARMKAFTVGFAEKDDSDEIAEAGETARLLGMEHHVVRVELPTFFDFLPRIVSFVEEPLATTSVVPMFYLSELASRSVKVVLSGQGADEAMGGYRRYQAELFRSYVPSAAVPWMKAAAKALHLKSDPLLRALDSIGEADDVRRFEQIYSVFNTDQITRLIGCKDTITTAHIRGSYDFLGCAKLPKSVERMMSLDLRLNLADDLLLYTDKITMRHSLECRVPFLDHDLIRYVESLPFKHRLGILRGKLLHKRFAARVLPRTVVNRKKKGFLSPTSRWFRNTGRCRDILLDPRSNFSSYFDLQEVRRVLEEHAAGMNRERHIFLLLGLHSWMGQFLAGSPGRAAALAAGA